jgi:hypothetical protein
VLAATGFPPEEPGAAPEARPAPAPEAVAAEAADDELSEEPPAVA